MSIETPIRIDIASVLASRLGRRASFVPRFMVHALERLIHQDELNGILERAFPLRDAAFCRAVLDDLNVDVRFRGIERLPADGRALFVCNHALGGLDGIAVIALLSEYYGTKAHMVVNDLLDAVAPLRDTFVPVNKHGAQSRDAVSLLDSVMAGDNPVAMFPAGLVSRYMPDGTIADLEWHKMFVSKAIEFRRPVVPLHFDGLNSLSFYRYARLRKKLGMKFNIEMILLPREVCRASGRRFTISAGHPIEPSALGEPRCAAATAARIRDIVYDIPNTFSSSL